MLFTSTGRYHPARTICASPNASLESVLLICIESAAFACRAWMHTIGMPAAFSACQCQTASGPVSIATFTARGAFVRTTSAIASGVERHVPCQTRLPSPSITQIAVSFWETSKPTYCSIANPPGGENLQVITACGSPASLRAPAESADDGSRTGVSPRPTRANALVTFGLRISACDNDTSHDAVLSARRPVAGSALLPPASPAPPLAASAGSPLFCDHRLQRSDVHRLFRHAVLQLTVLLLQLPQPPRVAQFQPAILALPAVKHAFAIPWRRHSSPVSNPPSDSFRMVMICSSLNRLFLTTPPLALAGHAKWRSHTFQWTISWGQVSTASQPPVIGITGFSC